MKVVWEDGHRDRSFEAMDCFAPCVIHLTSVVFQLAVPQIILVRVGHVCVNDEHELQGMPSKLDWVPYRATRNLLLGARYSGLLEPITRHQ